MSIENMKNMVVLRNLPSNIVEEAIVILKPNVKLKSLDLAENKTKNKKGESKYNSKKYIISEAEMVINNYLSKLEKDKKNSYKINKKIETKYKRVKKLAIFLGIMLIATFLIR